MLHGQQRGAMIPSNPETTAGQLPLFHILSAKGVDDLAHRFRSHECWVVDLEFHSTVLNFSINPIRKVSSRPGPNGHVISINPRRKYVTVMRRLNCKGD